MSNELINFKKVFIEEYRGFKIGFDTEHGIFQCSIIGKGMRESKSFSAVKKFIDDYKVLNQDFKPFWVEKIPGKYAEYNKLKIVGLRKDNKFIVEDENGKKHQLSDYDLNKYMLLNPENEKKVHAFTCLEIEHLNTSKIYTASRRKLLDSMDIVNLHDHKKTMDVIIKTELK